VVVEVVGVAMVSQQSSKEILTHSEEILASQAVACEGILKAGLACFRE